MNPHSYLVHWSYLQVSRARVYNVNEKRNVNTLAFRTLWGLMLEQLMLSLVPFQFLPTMLNAFWLQFGLKTTSLSD